MSMNSLEFDIWNYVIFVKIAILELWILLKKWDFEIAIFVKIEILKCDFCEKWASEMWFLWKM